MDRFYLTNHSKSPKKRGRNEECQRRKLHKSEEYPRPLGGENTIWNARLFSILPEFVSRLIKFWTTNFRQIFPKHFAGRTSRTTLIYVHQVGKLIREWKNYSLCYISIRKPCPAAQSRNFYSGKKVSASAFACPQNRINKRSVKSYTRRI